MSQVKCILTIDYTDAHGKHHTGKYDLLTNHPLKQKDNAEFLDVILYTRPFFITRMHIGYEFADSWGDVGMFFERSIRDYRTAMIKDTMAALAVLKSNIVFPSASFAVPPTFGFTFAGVPRAVDYDIDVDDDVVVEMCTVLNIKLINPSDARALELFNHYLAGKESVYIIHLKKQAGLIHLTKEEVPRLSSHKSLGCGWFVLVKRHGRYWAYYSKDQSVEIDVTDLMLKDAEFADEWHKNNLNAYKDEILDVMDMLGLKDVYTNKVPSYIFDINSASIRQESDIPEPILPVPVILEPKSSSCTIL